MEASQDRFDAAFFVMSAHSAVNRIICVAFDCQFVNGRMKVTVVYKLDVPPGALPSLSLGASREIAKEREGRMAMDRRVVNLRAIRLCNGCRRFGAIVIISLSDKTFSRTNCPIGNLGMVPSRNVSRFSTSRQGRIWVARRCQSLGIAACRKHNA